MLVGLHPAPHLPESTVTMTRLKVLYFASEYSCLYGARTHARGFYAALCRHPLVAETAIAPDTNAQAVPKTMTSGTLADDGMSASGRTRYNTLKAMYRRITPGWLQTQLDLVLPSPKTWGLLRDAIERERPDALILRTGRMFRRIECIRKLFPAMRICIEYNSCLFDESTRWNLLETFWRREETRQMSFADSISVVSAYLQRYLLSLAPHLEGRVFVNPNGVDSIRFRPAEEVTKRRSRQALGIPEEAIVFGYIGGMERFRRLPEVVAAMARLRTSGLDRLFLVLIGNGHDFSEVLHIARHYSSTSDHWIHCADVWEPHDRIPFRLAAFDVGIFPFSNPYVSPLKVLEYMACSLPVIGPEVPGITETINRGSLPFLVRQDGSNLSELVQHVYHHLDDCRLEAMKARTLVEREFTWEQNASRIISSLTSLRPNHTVMTRPYADSLAE